MFGILNTESNKKEFIKILKETCSDRFDVNGMINYLEKGTDFFTAPASSKFHLDVEGGLLQHTLNVYHCLSDLCEIYNDSCDKSTIAIVALFHDLCKVNNYKIEYKNVKTQYGWSNQPTYVTEDSFPIGHGEKSVIMLLQQGVNLTEEEILTIRWHMGAWDKSVKGGDLGLSNSYKKYPLIALLQCADVISTHILEK